LNLLPQALLHSLENVKGFNKETFVQVHASGEQVTSVRFNSQKARMPGEETIPGNHWNLPVNSTGHFPPATPIPWSSGGYYLAERPSFTFDPLLHAGVYYVQEASSMFLEQAFLQSVDNTQALRVLDLCAAPGGKSTLLQSLISKNSLLISNEVIKARAAILEENIIKWGAANVVVTNNDPAHFARLENYFDVIVIDAPCSGSGLFRRDPDAINEWSENNVALCSQRQQRIIADVWPALKNDGILIYSTCSYSAAEDESILDWLGNQFMVEGVPLQVNPAWGIVETASANGRLKGYRFYPDSVKGEGLFIASVQKKQGGAYVAGKPGKKTTEKLSVPATAIVKEWLQEDAALAFFKQGDAIIAMPAALQDDIAVLQSALYIKKAGVRLGKLAGNDLVPDHQLAVSTIISKNIPRLALNRDQAIGYLRKDDIQLPVAQPGWQLVSYEGHALGWIKMLPNRFNNYYPKEWRIMKQP
jgi:16S rRNA C967 or C1407 C5-methylase (RsmB/RsmF family)/NOL1/NOP2/fmu family ribosome biogenesis protein